jgi:uronate dehydrogenase
MGAGRTPTSMGSRLSACASALWQSDRRPRDLSTWLSPRDAVELFYCALTAPDVGYTVAYGASANKRGWWDLSSAERLGYRPADDAER